VLALHVLESNQWTNKFFSLWFSNIDSFTRVHDKKLSIAAIVSLLTLNADQVPVSVQTGWPRLLQGIVRLFQTLPAAQKSKFPNTSSFRLVLIVLKSVMRSLKMTSRSTNLHTMTSRTRRKNNGPAMTTHGMRRMSQKKSQKSRMRALLTLSS
jgi:hypothetical protein